MRKKKISLTQEQLTAYVSNLRMQAKLTEARRLIKDAQYTMLPAEVHQRLMAVCVEIDAVGQVLSNEVDSEIWKFYNL